MKKSEYYYAVLMKADDINSLLYFKAYSKKQIKKHLSNIKQTPVVIYDPSVKPVHGIYYHDITDVYYENGFESNKT